MLSTLVAIFGSSFLDNLSLKFYKSDRPIWGQSQRRSTDSNLNLNWSQHNSRLECNTNEVTAVLLLINGVSLSFSILVCTNKILKHENSRIQLAFAFDLDSPAQRSADGCYSCPYCNASEPAVFWTRHARQPRSCVALCRQSLAAGNLPLPLRYKYSVPSFRRGHMGRHTSHNRPITK